MGARYTHQAITTEQQIDILKERGLLIDNVEQAIEVLDTISYFRLAGYETRFVANLAAIRKEVSRSHDDFITEHFSFREQTLYPQLCYVVYWLNSISPDNTFVADFKQLLSKYLSVKTYELGFPYK